MHCTERARNWLAHLRQLERLPILDCCPKIGKDTHDAVCTLPEELCSTFLLLRTQAVASEQDSS